MATATPTAYEHIVLDGEGVAWIEGANTKVVELVGTSRAHGRSPEELAYQLPHLTLRQIHSAFAYSQDHREVIEDELRRRKRLAVEIRDRIGEHPLVAQLRARRQA